jgi:hypothetical protein
MLEAETLGREGKLWECYCQKERPQYVRWEPNFEARYLYTEDGHFVQVYNLLWSEPQWEVDIDWKLVATQRGVIDLQQSEEEMWEWVVMCCWMGSSSL